jgi:hypothetical protein
VPLSPARNEHLNEGVFGAILTLRRFDSDLADETNTVEIAEAADAPRLFCRVALIIRLDAARRFQHSAQAGAGDARSRGVAFAHAGNGEQGKEHTFGKFAVDDGELAIESF